MKEIEICMKLVDICSMQAKKDELKIRIRQTKINLSVIIHHAYFFSECMIKPRVDVQTYYILLKYTHRYLSPSPKSFPPSYIRKRKEIWELVKKEGRFTIYQSRSDTGHSL
jgi:hypothetical protein